MSMGSHCPRQNTIYLFLREQLASRGGLVLTQESDFCLSPTISI